MPRPESCEFRKEFMSTDSSSASFHRETQYLTEQGYGPCARRLLALWERRALEMAVVVAELEERVEQAEVDRDGLRCPVFVSPDAGD